MSRFSFKLARLARVRVVQEEIALAQWQSAETVAREALAREQAGRDAVNSATAELAQAQSSASIDPTHILQAREAIDGMVRRIKVLEEQTRTAQVESARLREPWQALRTELEGLKRLEKKAKTAFRIEREREEAKQNDEVAMERASRKDFPLRQGGE